MTTLYSSRLFVPGCLKVEEQSSSSSSPSIFERIIHSFIFNSSFFLHPKKPATWYMCCFFSMCFPYKNVSDFALFFLISTMENLHLRIPVVTKLTWHHRASRRPKGHRNRNIRHVQKRTRSPKKWSQVRVVSGWDCAKNWKGDGGVYTVYKKCIYIIMYIIINGGH